MKILVLNFCNKLSIYLSGWKYYSLHYFLYWFWVRQWSLQKKIILILLNIYNKKLVKHLSKVLPIKDLHISLIHMVQECGDHLFCNKLYNKWCTMPKKNSLITSDSNLLATLLNGSESSNLLLWPVQDQLLQNCHWQLWEAQFQGNLFYLFRDIQG